MKDKYTHLLLCIVRTCRLVATGPGAAENKIGKEAVVHSFMTKLLFLRGNLNDRRCTDTKEIEGIKEIRGQPRVCLDNRWFSHPSVRPSLVAIDQRTLQVPSVHPSTCGGLVVE